MLVAAHCLQQLTDSLADWPELKARYDANPQVLHLHALLNPDIQATTMGHIQRHHLSDAKVTVPPKLIPHAMSDVISPVFESLWKLAVESRTLAALRDTLLPKLISGELRVPDARRSAEKVA